MQVFFSTWENNYTILLKTKHKGHFNQFNSKLDRDILSFGKMDIFLHGKYSSVICNRFHGHSSSDLSPTNQPARTKVQQSFNNSVTASCSLQIQAPIKK